MSLPTDAAAQDAHWRAGSDFLLMIQSEGLSLCPCLAYPSEKPTRVSMDTQDYCLQRWKMPKKMIKKCWKTIASFVFVGQEEESWMMLVCEVATLSNLVSHFQTRL